MRWSSFRALETFAILYDIQIDEEEYEQLGCRVAASGSQPFREPFSKVTLAGQRRPWERMSFLPTPLGELADVPLRAVFTPNGRSNELFAKGRTVSVAGPGVPHLWRILLHAKRTRAALMLEGATSADSALDQLALDVLKQTPALPDGSLLWKGRLNSEAMQTAILRVLLFLEASASYRGYHSIACADDAINTLQWIMSELAVEPRQGQSPYELVALYNKAQGELHVRSYDKAGESFRKVAECSGCWHSGIPSDTYSFEQAPRGTLTPLRWAGEERLFADYVGRPAVLQIAEVLINMQRSGEARRALDRITADDASPYQSARKLILEGRVENDTGHPAGQLRLDGVLGLPRRPRRLHSQVDAVNTEREGLPLKRRARLVQRAGDAGPDRTEFDQAVLEWTKGLSRAVKGIQQGKSAAEIESVSQYLRLELPPEQRWPRPFAVDSFFDAACDLVEDPQYRDYRVEVRVKLSEGLWDMVLAVRSRVDAGATVKESQLSQALLDLSKFVDDAAEHLYKRLARSDGQEYIKDIWQARLSVIQRRLLPIERADDRQRSLRDFLFNRFLCADVGQGGGVVREQPTSCQSCQERLCLSPSCLDRLLAISEKNPSLLVRRDDGDGHVWHYSDMVAKRNSSGIDARLADDRSPSTPSGWAVAILQRWNSFTPAMAASEGGGYFVYHTPRSGDSHCATDVGLVVDPGYGFVKNFLSEGFCIDDITAIAVTHDHPDHLADFEAIHNLKVERDKALKKQQVGAKAKHRKSIDGLRTKSKLHVIVSDGARRHLERVVESSPVISDTVVVSADNSSGVWASSHVVPAFLGARQVKIHAVNALHKDISLASGPLGADSIGLRLELRDTKRKRAASVGLPSDTRWQEGISKQYADCSVVCLHLGSISGRGRRLLDFFRPEEVSDVLLDANHLFIPGVLWFIDDLAKTVTPGGSKLVVLSEFGEELSGGIRVALAKAFDAHAGEAVRVLAGDVGLLVDPVDESVRCSCCGEFYPWATTDFEYELFGDSEQIFYVCPSCDRSLSFDRKAAVFQESQRPLMRMILDR